MAFGKLKNETKMLYLIYYKKQNITIVHAKLELI